MKQYLQLLIVLGLNCLLSSSIYYTAESPHATMPSTSAITSCGSSLPCAAFTGFVSADEILQCFNNLPTSPRRIGRNKAYNLVYYNKPIGNYTAELPNATMRSISVITSCGSSLPCPAFTGFVSADDNLSEGSNDLPSGPRLIGGNNMNQGEDPDNLDDPWKTPVGDIPWGMMVVCILIYMYVIYRKSINIPADKP